MAAPRPASILLLLEEALAVHGARLGALSERALPLDTVHVDLDAATMSLCWRLSLDAALDIQAAMIFARR